MAGLVEILAALAAQLESELAPVIAGLQVVAGRELFPTPPCIDIYPADQGFYEVVGFGPHDPATVYWIVRARVTTADEEAGQSALLAMMDPRADESVVAALLSDKTLNSTVDDLQVDPPAEYGIWTSPGSTTQGLLGCTWRTGVML